MRLRALLLITHQKHLPEMDLSRSPRVSGGRGWGPEKNRDRQICFSPRGKQKDVRKGETKEMLELVSFLR